MSDEVTGIESVRAGERKSVRASPRFSDFPISRSHEFTGWSTHESRITLFRSTLIAARFWTQQYEWQAHREHAIKAGLNPATADAIAEGRRPAGMKDDEEIVYELLTETLHNKSVSDATYARAVAKFGEAGVVDLVGVVGYYLMLAMIMNMARTALPAGKSPQLAPFPY